jgi:hypothetical protein
MKACIVIIICFFCFSTTQAFASNFLEVACENDDSKGYCMALLQGFLTGYQLGHHNGTFNATAAEGEAGPKLCVPDNLTSGDIYDEMHPHLSKDIGFLDLSLLVAALNAFPCEKDENKKNSMGGG